MGIFCHAHLHFTVELQVSDIPLYITHDIFYMIYNGMNIAEMLMTSENNTKTVTILILMPDVNIDVHHPHDNIVT